MNRSNLLTVDEKLNALTHCIGFIIALIGTPILILQAFEHGNNLITVAVSIFCISMIWMYLSSTFYHLTIDEGIKKLWQKIDHISIFALIGGTYTPFIAIYYSKWNGWSFLGLLWAIIFAGVILKLFRTGKYRILSTIIYLILGWMVVLIYQPITEKMSSQVFCWLIAGGLFYSVGVIFYLWSNLRFHHAIWHLFVVAGTFSHFLSLLFSI